MMTISKVVRIIERCQLSSEMDEAYDAAIDVLNGAYDDYIRSARVHLENARRLEKGCGDDQHARRALDALDSLTAAEA